MLQDNSGREKTLLTKQIRLNFIVSFAVDFLPFPTEGEKSVNEAMNLRCLHEYITVYSEEEWGSSYAVA